MGFYKNMLKEMTAGGTNDVPSLKEVLELRYKLILKEFTYKNDNDWDNPDLESKSGKPVLSQAVAYKALKNTTEELKSGILNDENAEEKILEYSYALRTTLLLMMAQARNGATIDERVYDEAQLVVSLLSHTYAGFPNIRKHIKKIMDTAAYKMDGKQYSYTIFSPASIERDGITEFLVNVWQLWDKDSLATTSDGKLYGIPNLDKLEDPVERNELVKLIDPERVPQEETVVEQAVVDTKTEQAVVEQAVVDTKTEQAVVEQEVVDTKTEQAVIKTEIEDSSIDEALEKISNDMVKDLKEVLLPKFSKDASSFDTTSVLKTVGYIAAGAALGVAAYKAWEYFTDDTTTVYSTNSFWED